MPIQVTCPGCLKRFQVNDKFAGKTGPCPSCSKPITIPAKSDEVVIHAPENEGPKDGKGRPVFKPIRRQEVKITLPVALAAGVIAVLSIGIALLVRITSGEPPTALLILGTVFLAPPLVYAGYWFLRDDELGGFQGVELIARVAIVSLIFMITWAIFAFIPKYLADVKSLADVDVYFLLLTIPIMLILGATAATLALELEVVQGGLHYLLYFSVTLILALIMGAQIARPFARSPSTPPASSVPSLAEPPSAATPATAPSGAPRPPANTGAPPKAPSNQGEKKSRLLQ